MNETVCGNNFHAVNRKRLIAETSDNRSCLFGDHKAGSSVPWFEVLFPVAVKTARSIAAFIAAGDADSAEQEMYRHLSIVNWPLEKEFRGDSDNS